MIEYALNFGFGALSLAVLLNLWRLLRRSLQRIITREELWNGNVEGPLATFFTDPEHIVRWAWSTRHTYRERVPQVEADHENLVVVRLRSHREVETWLSLQEPPTRARGRAR